MNIDLSPWRQGVEAATEALIVWAWQQSLFHRSSSLAESLHSWLRPHLQIHRGMPKGLRALLQLFWNHHTFERGQRAGHSPLELAGVADTPSLLEVLDRLFPREVAAQTI